ncbi:hypothetical protein V2J09_020773 [Rumex salicifolius]
MFSDSNFSPNSRFLHCLRPSLAPPASTAHQSAGDQPCARSRLTHQEARNSPLAKFSSSTTELIKED